MAVKPLLSKTLSYLLLVLGISGVVFLVHAPLLYHHCLGRPGTNVPHPIPTIYRWYEKRRGRTCCQVLLHCGWDLWWCHAGWSLSGHHARL